MRIAVFALLSLAVSSASAFQIETPSSPPAAPRVTVYDFPDEEVGGTRATPNGDVVIVHTPDRLPSLVKVRADFDAELIDSAHSL